MSTRFYYGQQDYIAQLNAMDDVSPAGLQTALAAQGGAGLIGNIATGVGAVQRTIDSNLRERQSVLGFGAVGNGVTDDTAALQRNATHCDSLNVPYMYIVTNTENYLISAPIVFNEPGVRIFGNKAASYNRGGGKAGNILIGAGAGRALDLGNSRTTGNPADNWAVENIGFLQNTGVAANTKDGISFTSRTNGPDRGALIKSVSFIGLRDAITVENADLETSLANLVIENCVFQGCLSALNARGNLLGLRFVGNQCEQNIGTSGVLHGSINGGAAITDNMLEGQANVVSIDIPPVTGNRPHVEFSRNYLEANVGDYVLRFRCTAGVSSLQVGPNMLAPGTYKDYVLFEGGSGLVLFDMRDEQTFALKNTNIGFKYGSRPFNNAVREYGVRALTSGFMPEVILSEFQNLVDYDTSFVHALPGVGTTAMTPYGVKNIAAGGGFFPVVLPVVAGDLAVLNILCRIKEVAAGNLSIQVYNNNTTVVVSERGDMASATELNGRWALVSIPFVAQTTATELRVRFLAASGTYDLAIAGISAKNYGAFANNGSTKVMVRPVVPNVA